MKYNDHANVHTPYEQHVSLATQQKIWIGEAIHECESDLISAKRYKHTKYISREQHKILANLQKTWSNEAKKDAEYNYKQYTRFQKDGRHILAQGYKKEYEWSMMWYHIRKKLADLHKKLSHTDYIDKHVLYKAYMKEHEFCKLWVHKRFKLLDYHEKMAEKLK